jgi:hypothetical protein
MLHRSISTLKSSTAIAPSDLNHSKRNCTRFNAHMIGRGLVQRVLRVVFAAEPLAQLTPTLGGGETTRRTLYVRFLIE